MADLSDFKRGQIVGDRMADASVTKIGELFDGARSPVSKVKTAFEKEGKSSSLKQNSGRKRKLSDRGRRNCLEGLQLWKLPQTFPRTHFLPKY